VEKQDVSFSRMETDYPQAQYTDTLSGPQLGSVIPEWLKWTCCHCSFAVILSLKPGVAGTHFPPVNLTLTRWPSYINLT